jgi:hypothetical protein
MPRLFRLRRDVHKREVEALVIFGEEGAGKLATCFFSSFLSLALGLVLATRDGPPHFFIFLKAA